MTKIYNSHGWHPTAGTAIAFLGVGIFALLVRGPHETGWIGWSGGRKVLKKEKMNDTSANAVTEKFKSKKRRHRVRSLSRDRQKKKRTSKRRLLGNISFVYTLT